MLSPLRLLFSSIKCKSLSNIASLRTLHHGSSFSKIPSFRLQPQLPPPMVAPTSIIREVTLPTTSTLKLSLIGDFIVKREILAPTLNHVTEIKAPTSSDHSQKGPVFFAERRPKRLIKKPRPRPKNMLRIRKEKMNKHKRVKRRRKFASKIKTIELTREVAKEKLFRAELLSDIRRAEAFNAESYVKSVLTAIANKPRQESLWERKRRFDRLKRIHRSNVEVVRPEFDDPVP